eukprot:Opistho-2@1272
MAKVAIAFAALLALCVLRVEAADPAEASQIRFVHMALEKYGKPIPLLSLFSRNFNAYIFKDVPYGTVQPSSCYQAITPGTHELQLLLSDGLVADSLQLNVTKGREYTVYAVGLSVFLMPFPDDTPQPGNITHTAVLEAKLPTSVYISPNTPPAVPLSYITYISFQIGSIPGQISYAMLSDYPTIDYAPIDSWNKTSIQLFGPIDLGSFDTNRLAPNALTKPMTSTNPLAYLERPLNDSDVHVKALGCVSARGSPSACGIATLTNSRVLTGTPASTELYYVASHALSQENITELGIALRGYLTSSEALSLRQESMAVDLYSPGRSVVRFMHAAAQTGALSIYVNEVKTATLLGTANRYGLFSSSWPPGTVTLLLVDAGTQAIISVVGDLASPVELLANKEYTVVVGRRDASNTLMTKLVVGGVCVGEIPNNDTASIAPMSAAFASLIALVVCIASLF